MATPPLPDLGPAEDDEDEFEWHPMTVVWWEDIWSSPMAPEFEASDIHGLFMLAKLVDAFWYDPSVQLAGEIRLQRQCFGLTPIDRRRLQWEIDRGEEADKSTRQRREASKPKAVPKRGAAAADPRDTLTG